MIIGWLPASSSVTAIAKHRRVHCMVCCTSHSSSRFADPSFLTSCERSRGIAAFVALMCAVGAVGLCLCQRTRSPGLCFSVLVPAQQYTGVDVHWSSGKFCASGGGTSGMAQSVGYLLAACGPPLMGKYTMLTVTGLYHLWVLPYFPTDGDFRTLRRERQRNSLISVL